MSLPLYAAVPVKKDEATSNFQHCVVGYITPKVVGDSNVPPQAIGKVVYDIRPKYDLIKKETYETLKNAVLLQSDEIKGLKEDKEKASRLNDLYKRKLADVAQNANRLTVPKVQEHDAGAHTELVDRINGLEQEMQVLRAENQQLRAENHQLRVENHQLRDRVQNLEARAENSVAREANWQLQLENLQTHNTELNTLCVILQQEHATMVARFDQMSERVRGLQLARGNT
jgi:chromosome segregation ATPase